jgi:hypothetical protein
VPARTQASMKMSSVTVPLLAKRSRSLMHLARLVQEISLSSRFHVVMTRSHSKSRISEEPETAWQKPTCSKYASWAHALYGATV